MKVVEEPVVVTNCVVEFPTKGEEEDSEKSLDDVSAEEKSTDGGVQEGT